MLLHLDFSNHSWRGKGTSVKCQMKQAPNQISYIVEALITKKMNITRNYCNISAGYINNASKFI